MRNILKAAAGLSAAAVVGYAGFVLREKAVEKPDYRVIERDGPFELRAYPPLLAAAAVTRGEREQALNAGFRKLADYIFAKSRGGKPIAMTAPVLQDREPIAMTAPVLQDSPGEGTWRTRFVMPGEYTRDTLPPPPAGVTIEEIPARRVAVMRFAGGQNDRRLAERLTELRVLIQRRGLMAVGEPEYAFYNSPFTVPLLRRNEVLIPVAA